MSLLAHAALLVFLLAGPVSLTGQVKDIERLKKLEVEGENFDDQEAITYLGSPDFLRDVETSLAADPGNNQVMEITTEAAQFFIWKGQLTQAAALLSILEPAAKDYEDSTTPDPPGWSPWMGHLYLNAGYNLKQAQDKLAGTPPAPTASMGGSSTQQPAPARRAGQRVLPKGNVVTNPPTPLTTTETAPVAPPTTPAMPPAETPPAGSPEEVARLAKQLDEYNKAAVKLHSEMYRRPGALAEVDAILEKANPIAERLKVIADGDALAYGKVATYESYRETVERARKRVAMQGGAGIPLDPNRVKQDVPSRHPPAGTMPATSSVELTQMTSAVMAATARNQELMLSNVRPNETREETVKRFEGLLPQYKATVEEIAPSAEKLRQATAIDRGRKATIAIEGYDRMVENAKQFPEIMQKLRESP